MPTLGDRIRTLREAAGFSNQGDFAGQIGVPQSTVSRWETDVYKPGRPNLIKISAALHCTVDALMEGVDGLPDPARHTSTGELNAEPYEGNIERGYKKRDVPIVGDAEASTNGVISWDDTGLVRGEIEDWVSRAFSDGDPKAYALRIRGDSMVPRYAPGEIVIAQPRLQVRDGDYACVQLVSGERLIKRVFREAGRWILRSLNTDYPDRTVLDEDVAALHRIKHSTQV